MKKLVFAVQVFGLMAMFVAVVILEMNHKKGDSYEKNSTAIIKQNAETKSIYLPQKAKDKTMDENTL
jgi:hypothetical protein